MLVNKLQGFLVLEFSSTIGMMISFMRLFRGVTSRMPRAWFGSAHSHFQFPTFTLLPCQRWDLTSARAWFWCPTALEFPCAWWVCVRALCLWLLLCSSVTTKQRPGFHFGQNTHSHVNNKLFVGWRYARCNFSCGCMLLNKVLVLMQFSACKLLQEHGTQIKILSFTQNYSLLIFFPVRTF